MRASRRSGGARLVRRSACAVALVAVLPACERGCLMKAAADHGAVPSTSAQTPMVRGQDCAPDLLRCQHGTLSRSLGGFVPESRGGPTERCACPWTPVGECPQGCAKDDLEVAFTADAGPMQLCAGPPAAVLGGAIPEGVPCDEELGIVCHRGVLVRCERPLRLLATCTQGCTLSDLPSDVEDRAAIMLACKR